MKSTEHEYVLVGDTGLETIIQTSRWPNMLQLVDYLPLKSINPDRVFLTKEDAEMALIESLLKGEN